MKLNKECAYDLSELTSEQWDLLKPILNKNSVIKFNYDSLEDNFRDGFKTIYFTSESNWALRDDYVNEPTINAKELFYTLENVQVDCRELTEEQIKKMADVFENSGFNLNLNGIYDEYFYLRLAKNEGSVDFFKLDNTKTEITYEKFMELFANKEKSEEFNNLVEVLNEELTEEAYKETEYEVKYIAEKPKQYQIGIDTFNPQPHYNNENGSLYKIATDLGLNHWEFDIFKRLVRCRKKNQFKEDLQKIKDTIDIYLNEYSE